MRTLVALSTLAVSLLLTSCRDQDPLSPDVAVPDFAIMDAAHGGANPDFFFLPPMVPDPVGHVNFDDGEFNSDLKPVVFICELEVTSGDPVDTTECDPDAGALKIEFTMNTGPGSETVRLNEADEHYIVNWHTDEFGLDPDRFYRIHVGVGATPLGFADVNPLSNGRELRNVDTDQVIGLVDGRTLPIKFRIESGALCDPPEDKTCTSGTIDLEQGGSVVLDGTGDRIDIPAQDEGALPTIDGEPVTDVTITLELCDGDIDVDLPTFGNCLRITTDPQLTELNDDLDNWGGFSPRALISMCSAATSGDFGLGEQQDLLTVHRDRGDGFVQALPHADDNCAGEAETTAWADGLRGLAQRSLHALGRGISRLGGPAPLHARARLVRLDVGLGGESEFSSEFQLALPAEMTPLEGTQQQEAVAGSDVQQPPAVLVTDRDGAPVQGATVRFEVTLGGGSLAASNPIAVLSGSDGIAAVDRWTLGGEPGVNRVKAFGFGIAGEGQEPFMPVNRGPVTDEPIPSDQQEIVDLETGEVFFTAGGCSSEPCVVETIDLTVGGGVGLPVEGDRLDIPKQDKGALPTINGDLVTEVTIILELCDEDIDVDLPTFGNCLRITTDPELTELNTALKDATGEAAWGGFSPRALVSMCSASEGFGLEDQHKLLTVHRERDDGFVQALPHAVDNCIQLGSRPLEDRGTFVQRSLDALRRGVARLAGPEPLHAHARARLVRLDVGLGGESEFSSKFQLALPAEMTPLEGTQQQEAVAGSDVQQPPAVLVTDRDEAPVQGATVRFEVTLGDGSLAASNPIEVLSGSDGIAAVDRWTLGEEPGENRARAFGKGIAGPADGGPFMPVNVDELGDPVPTEDQKLVELKEGEVVFTASAVEPADLPDLVIQSFTHSPVEPTSFHLITVTAVVANVGSGPAGPSVAGIDIGGEPSPGVLFDVPALEPGESFAVSREICLIPQGYLNFAFADVNDDVVESNEENNEKRLSFTVTEGTVPVMDGHQCPGEWDGAMTWDFDVNTPEGQTTPGRLFVKNDDTNLFLAVRFDRDQVDPGGNSASFEFDSDRSGTLNHGDDGIIVNPEIGFRDLVRQDCVLNGVQSVCSVRDTDLGGTRDGDGAFGNDGQFTVYEFVHPLNSGDEFDFARAPGDDLGLFLRVRMIAEGAEFPAGFGDTRFPSTGFLPVTLQGLEP